MNKHYRFLILVPLAAVILSACSSALTDVSQAGPPEIDAVLDSVTEDEAGQVESDPVQDDGETPAEVLSSEPEPPVIPESENHSEAECSDPFEGQNLRFRETDWETNFCKHSVPYDEFLSGGPPRDGIPPIDDPRFETVESADGWLEDREPVITLALNGEARAYPLQILIWHEIVNDTVSDIPVVATFCPLCNTALVFKRLEIDGELLTFGTSGNLRNSDLVMWDRQTESWWQQFSGEAVVGDLTGTQLDFLPTAITAWADFKVKYPGGEVLSKDTGFLRNYGNNPYVGYDDVGEFPFLFDGPLDDQISPMTRVLGVNIDGQASAYTNERLSIERVINDTLGEVPIAAFWKAGTASAVDASSIPDGRDVGTTGVFLRSIDGQVLTFTAKDNGTFEDDATGSTWDILGEAVDGALTGTILMAVPHHDTFWFAWAAFVPGGDLTE